jgi:predicted enzyme related to lactoylglutathione lyase
VQVRNLEESIGLAETLGGRLLRASFDAPTGTTLAIILDPEGNRLVLVQQ